MAVVSLGATGVKMLTNHEEVFQSAEELMALATMSSGVDLYAVTKNANGTDYTYKLWADLQVKGCNQAIDFIAQHEDSGWGKVTIDELGIPANDRQLIYNLLQNDRLMYMEFGAQRIAE